MPEKRGEPEEEWCTWVLGIHPDPARKQEPPIEPTAQQQAAVDDIVAFVLRSVRLRRDDKRLDKPAYVFSGIAGAGKTTCASWVIERLGQEDPGLRVAYLGSTHRARIQLEHRLARDLGLSVKTHTVWAAVFHTGTRYFCLKTPKDERGRHETVQKLPREMACESCAKRGKTRCGCPVFSRCSHAAHHLHCDVDGEPVASKEPRETYPFGDPDLIYVDEGSMVTREQMAILLSWGIPLIMSGDHAQLGPVVLRDDGPEKHMCDEMHSPDVILTQPMRQDPDSALYRLAQAYRHGEDVPVKSYDENTSVIEASDQRVPEILMRFGATAVGECMMITPWNQPRSLVNHMVHLLYHHGDVVVPGERIIAVKQGEAYRIWRADAGVIRNLAVYLEEWEGIEASRRMLQKEIDKLGRILAKILDSYSVTEDAGLPFPACMQAASLRIKINELNDEINRLPPSRLIRPVKRGFAVVERVQPDPWGDKRYLYAVIRLESPYPWDVAADRAVVRMARDQFGRERTLTETTAPPKAALWDYGHCVTPWSAQGGEWDSVLVMGTGWPDIYRRAGYVAASRARERLLVIGDQRMQEDQAAVHAVRALRAAKMSR